MAFKLSFLISSNRARCCCYFRGIKPFFFFSPEDGETNKQTNKQLWEWVPCLSTAQLLKQNKTKKPTNLILVTQPTAVYVMYSTNHYVLTLVFISFLRHLGVLGAGLWTRECKAACGSTTGRGVAWGTWMKTHLSLVGKACLQAVHNSFCCRKYSW